MSEREQLVREYLSDELIGYNPYWMLPDPNPFLDWAVQKHLEGAELDALDLFEGWLSLTPA